MPDRAPIAGWQAIGGRHEWSSIYPTRAEAQDAARRMQRNRNRIAADLTALLGSCPAPDAPITIRVIRAPAPATMEA